MTATKLVRYLRKRRSKRRAMSLVGIVMWSMLVGGAFTFVNGLGLFATYLASPDAPSVSAALQDTSCKIAASGIPYNCTGNVNAPGSDISSIYTFGYFLWSFVQAIPTIMAGALTPGSLAQQWFGPVGLLINIGMLTLFALFAWSVVGNRPKDFTVE